MKYHDLFYFSFDKYFDSTSHKLVTPVYFVYRKPGEKKVIIARYQNTIVKQITVQYCKQLKNYIALEAASLIFGGQTAIYFLQKAQIKNWLSDRILVIGAIGSVGTTAMQIAVCYGAHITVVCSTAGKPLMENLGVSSIILYDQEDFTMQENKYDIILMPWEKPPENSALNF